MLMYAGPVSFSQTHAQGGRWLASFPHPLHLQYWRALQTIMLYKAVLDAFSNGKVDFADKMHQDPNQTRVVSNIAAGQPSTARHEHGSLGWTSMPG